MWNELKGDFHCGITQSFGQNRISASRISQNYQHFFSQKFSPFWGFSGLLSRILYFPFLSTLKSGKEKGTQFILLFQLPALSRSSRVTETSEMEKKLLKKLSLNAASTLLDILSHQNFTSDMRGC